MEFLCIFLTVIACLTVRVESKAVFAHFMVGNTHNYTQSDWETDIRLAQEAHIDAFALNIANEVSSISAPLQLAFNAANRLGFKLFFSLDYAGNGPWDKEDVIRLCITYCNNEAYYHSNGGPMISTFEGPENAADWIDIKAATNCFFVPDWSSLGAKPALQQANGIADALFNWEAWPWGDLDMTTYTDASYWMYLSQAGGKPYMMPASPWFYTNLPGYNKNWLWRGDDIWYDRWIQIIYNQPEFVEIISWNDYGESHYIGPLYDKAMEAFSVGKAPFNYVNNMPHDGWRAFLPYLIDLYKQGTAAITREGVQGWWRRAPAAACADGDTTGNTASQLQMELSPASIMADKIFFSALLGSEADVTVTVGSTSLNAQWTWVPDGGVGIHHGSVEFGAATGDVSISITRAGKTVASLSPGAGGSIGTQSCVNGLQNWNAFVASAWGDSVSATPTLKVSEQKCINGTGYGNFAGICGFSCKYGVCDSSACVCKAMGSPSATPSGVAPTGYPAAGLDASYSGICAFDCEHGYCPPSACSLEESPLTTPTVSDFSPPACVEGVALAGADSPLGGLCGYACNYGFCPYHTCSCTAQGGLIETPDIIAGHDGKATEGVEDHGLCAFACKRGYCPSPTCVDASSSGSGDSGSHSSLPGGVFGENPGWSSETGQFCYKTPCSENPTWGSAQNMAVKPYPDDCPEGQYRTVVCPLDGTPGDCKWRGSGGICDPTCEPGEVAIETSQHGSEFCEVGRQGLCCQSETWRNLVSSCSWEAADTCPMVGQVKVASRQRPFCSAQSSDGCKQYSQFDEIFCCDADFPNCKWSSCSKNVCNSQQIEVALDEYGENGFGCATTMSSQGAWPTGEDQALCCDNPEHLNPFLPVQLDWLFPTLPPDEDLPAYDLTHIESKLQPNIPLGPLQPFGFVVIDGPADLVTSLSKRDGSHVEFLDCESSSKTHETTVYTARYICTNDSSDSNCDDLHLGGAAGTVVKLPEKCGYASYGVVHEAKVSSNQSVPVDILETIIGDMVVHEVSFSYDFRKVRRASQDDPVYVRIDYSSMSAWWRQVVDSAPSRKRDPGSDIRKRFWSQSDETWKNKIEQIRKSANNEDGQLLGILNPYFSKPIYQQTSDTCTALENKRGLSDDGFLSINLEGSVSTQMRWGYTMVGTISPTLNLEEAHGFFDAAIGSDVRLFVDGSGSLSIDGTVPVTELFGKGGITDFGWSQPGIVSFQPNLNIALQMEGSGNIDANFTVRHNSMPGALVQTNSVGMGDFSGSIDSALSSHDFTGSVTASETSGSEVVLGLRVMPQAQIDFTVFDYSTSNAAKLDTRDATLASAEFSVQFTNNIHVTSDGSGIQVIDSYDPIYAWVRSNNISPAWTSEGEATVALGAVPSPAVVYSGEGEAPEERGPPNLPGDPVFSGNFIHCTDASEASSLTCLPARNVSDIDTDLKNDYDGENEAANAEDAILQKYGLLETREIPFWDIAQYLKPKVSRTQELEPRSTGKPRDWPIKPLSGNTFTSLSSPYITGNSGQLLLGANPNAGTLNLANSRDCLSAAITDAAGPSRDLASEHILEQNLVALGWEYVMTGFAPGTTQAIEWTSRFRPYVVPEHLMGANGVFRQTWDQWDPNAPAGAHDNPRLSPEREMWDAIGSIAHPEYLVNLQQQVNSFKSRVMRGISGIGADRWTKYKWDDTSDATGKTQAEKALSEIRLFQGVVNYLNHPRVHAPFIASLNRISDIMDQFDAAVARNNLNGGVQTHAGTLWREFIYEVVFSRTETSQSQYRQWLQRMRTNWTAAGQNAVQNGASSSSPRMTSIRKILNDIADLLKDYDPVKNADKFVINKTGLFENPPSI